MRKFCTLLLIVAACGDNKSAATTDGNPTLPPDAAIDAPPSPPDGPDVNPACLAPFVMPVDTTAQATATTELATLDPAATMTWADTRNTLQSISGLVVKLPDCTGTTNAFDLLFAHLAAHPALYQIDPTEWTGSVAQCSDILANGFHPLTIRRAKYGPYTIANDVFTAVADVQNGVVILRNFSGTYIPKPSQVVLDALSSCPDLTQDVIARHIFTSPFAYQAYQSTGPACTVEGNHTYALQAGDAVTYDPQVAFNWTEDTQITFQRQGTATIVVGQADYSDQLLNSSANCIDIDGNNNVGWQRTYNSVTAEVLFDHATPDPFCTVCLVNE
ncbi:MAG: hypothetical protein QM831_43205 [Kofleriaceae bacterium]